MSIFLNRSKDSIQVKESVTNLTNNNSTNKNLLQLNAANLYVRRGSNLSNSSYSTESSSVNGTHLSPDYSFSPRTSLMKRKRKLMEKNNKACDQFIQRINKHEEKQLTKQISGANKLSDSSGDEEDSDEQIKVHAKNKLSHLKLKDHLLDTSLGCSSISSKSTSSSSSISLTSESSSLTDVCSKSLIFAPKELYKFKEKLFKKSLSEKRSKKKQSVNQQVVYIRYFRLGSQQ